MAFFVCDSLNCTFDLVIFFFVFFLQKKTSLDFVTTQTEEKKTLVVPATNFHVVLPHSILRTYYTEEIVIFT
jgi:hypothetical protein